MESIDVSYAGAFLAGMLSFASPCVLPLVPAYLGFLGGVSYAELTRDGAGLAVRRRVLAAATAFVLGFATVFVALGATATAVSRVLAEHMDLFGKIAGALIILLGLHYADLIRIPFLQRDARPDVPGQPAGLAGAYVTGLAFAFGWTPCVGPVLATILMVAGAGDSVGYGVSLLGTYALGMGLPFLAAAAAAKPFFELSKKFRSQMRAVQLATGGLIVATGVLIFAGSMSVIGQWMLETFPAFGRIG
ncbi:MAG TPA: cytochrome c biogenesis protein CcdA [Alphaproteobacteria bacterium]|nr:cytochrome c biogenesis protein CcdA [Alphaproteobacteria bacterium]